MEDAAIISSNSNDMFDCYDGFIRSTRQVMIIKNQGCQSISYGVTPTDVKPNRARGHSFEVRDVSMTCIPAVIDKTGLPTKAIS